MSIVLSFVFALCHWLLDIIELNYKYHLIYHLLVAAHLSLNHLSYVLLLVIFIEAINSKVLV
jgi:hypothetical protein